MQSGKTPSVEDWEPPIPLENDPVPPFPVEALSSKVATFVIELARFTETAPDVGAVLALAALAAALAGKVCVAPKDGYSEPLNIMCLVALGPGERKSAVLRRVFQPLEAKEREMQAEARARSAVIASRRDELSDELRALERRAKGGKDASLATQIERVRRERDSLPARVDPRLLADDATPESIAPLLAANGGRLCIASAEGGLVAILRGRYSQGIPNIDVFLKGHAGDAIRVDRRNAESIVVHHPTLSVALAVQPSVLTELATQREFRSRGLVARFLFAQPPARAGTRNYDEPRVPETIEREYDGTLERLLSLSAVDPPRTILLTDGAREVWLRFAVEVDRKCAEGGELISLADWTSKLPGAVARIAGILHMTDLAWREAPWLEPLTAATMARAIAVGRYFIAHARVALGAVPRDERVRDAEALLRWGTRRRQFTIREVQRSLRHRFRSVEEVRAAAAVLVEHGFIRAKPPPALHYGRPPSEAFDVHPDYVDESAPP